MVGIPMRAGSSLDSSPEFFSELDREQEAAKIAAARMNGKRFFIK